MDPIHDYYSSLSFQNIQHGGKDLFSKLKNISIISETNDKPLQIDMNLVKQVWSCGKDHSYVLRQNQPTQVYPHVFFSNSHSIRNIFSEQCVNTHHECDADDNDNNYVVISKEGPSHEIHHHHYQNGPQANDHHSPQQRPQHYHPHHQSPPPSHRRFAHVYSPSAPQRGQYRHHTTGDRQYDSNHDHPPPSVHRVIDRLQSHIANHPYNHHHPNINPKIHEYIIPESPEIYNRYRSHPNNPSNNPVSARIDTETIGERRRRRYFQGFGVGGPVHSGHPLYDSTGLKTHAMSSISRPESEPDCYELFPALHDPMNSSSSTSFESDLYNVLPGTYWTLLSLYLLP